MWDMQEFRALAPQRGAAPEPVTGGTPLGRIDGRLGEPPPAPQSGTVWRVDRVVFGLPPGKGCHGEGRSQDEGHPFVSPKIGQPLPGAETLDRDPEAATAGGDGLEPGFGCGIHVAVHPNVTVVAQATDVPASGMPIETPVKWLGVGVEVHEVASCLGTLHFPLPAYHWGRPRGRPQSLSSHWSGRLTRQVCGACSCLLGGRPPLTANVRPLGHKPTVTRKSRKATDGHSAD
jgi:hypothetical protein